MHNNLLSLSLVLMHHDIFVHITGIGEVMLDVK
jgi:hypothetical protein